MVNSKKLIKDIKEKLSETGTKIGKTVSDISEYTKQKQIERENIQAQKSGFVEGKRRKSAGMKEEAKVQALLNLKAQQALTPRVAQVPQVQQPQLIPRRGMNIYSFTNRPFMSEEFMGENPFSGSSPFFPKRRRKL